MRRPLYISLFVFCLFFIASQVSSAVSIFRIDEAKIKMTLLAENAEVTLPIENSSNQTHNAVVTLELIAPNGSFAANTAQTMSIKPNANTITLPLNFNYKKLKYDEQEKILWYRLHYRITPENANTVEGIVSLSQLLTDFFELHAVAPKKVQAGGSVRVVARTTHPLSSKPIANILIIATIEFDDEEKNKPLTAKATTNTDGYAVFDFTLPRKIEESEIDLTVTAKRGEFEQEANEDLEIDKGANIFVSTDKTLYQPGQTLHIRALVFDNGNRALPNQEIKLLIKDHEYSVVHRDTLQTSRFGVANADWQIPNDTKLGDYTIQLELDDDNYSDATTNYSVKISRYDLPNFVVNTKTDKPYYTPDQQTAEVAVKADYLFGQPVKRGKVRVVREKERKWNYKEQKYDITEGETHEGNTEEEGHYKVKLDLKEIFKSLMENDYDDYNDIRYAAYFTDPTTNRTEQRRFDVRVTKHPIHIYVSRFSSQQHKNLPVDFFITTNYADGTPVSCDVTINEELPKPNAENEDETILRPLQTVKTNRFGVAKVTGLKPQGGAEGREDRVYLTLNAKDAQGKIGEDKRWFWFEDEDVVRVNASRTILRDGEAIKATITSNVQDEFVIVDVVRDYKVIRTQTVQLRNGQANVMFPYNKDFTGLIGIVAYLPETESRSYYSYYYDLPIGSASVIYPHDQELKTTVRMSQTQYKPGEDATVNFDVRKPDGKAVESALGVVVFDKAVEERARTDSEFGSQFGFYSAMRRLLRDEIAAGGYSLRDLYKLDMKKPLPEGLNVLAELLVGASYYYPNFFDADNFKKDYWDIFRPYIDPQFSLFKDALNKKYQSSGVYPNDEETLQRLLHPSGISLKQLFDPWGTLYRYSFKPIDDKQTLKIESAGPDKRFGTDDDFTVNTISRNYFQFTGEAINRAIERYYTRTGDYVRNENQLKAELKREGIDFDSLRDPWGKPYRLNFYAAYVHYYTQVESAGENGKFEEEGAKKSDDVSIWANQFNYFVTDRARIENALIAEYQTTKRFPQNENEFKEFLKNRGVDFDSLRDPWGQSYYATFKTESRYADRSTTVTYIRYGENSTNKITPVTQTIQYITIRSKGYDKKEGTQDDFSLADYSRIVAEQAADEPKPKLTDSLPTPSGQVGSITGTVVDANGAVIASATVKAKHISTNREFNTTTTDDGTFIIRNLPTGIYEVRFDAMGFKTAVYTQVLVKQNSIVSINATLEVGTVNAVVEVVSSGDADVNTQDQQLSTTVSQRTINNLPLNSRNPLSLIALKPGTTSDKFGTEQNEQIATPRLREYFPETLVWQPSIETDKQGRAKINFKLADNITTWKMSVVSSTADGKIGIEEKEFLSFLPFFAEHDPPKILTEGDEISLPVVLRNYTEKNQSVAVEMKPESWFSLLSPSKQNTEVPMNDSKNAVFTFRAIASVDGGKQRVTARATSESDAIEKPVSVHPDGEEKSFAVGDVFANQVAFNVNLPNETIKNSQRAQLKIYPNLMSHVAESIEGILHRPYGCGEQTISSTYPSVLILKANKNGNKVSNRVLEKANKFAREGYKRLMNYRSDGGGFTYWGRGDADLALTAYAVRFLTDASEVITIDEEVLKSTREWLIKKQNADGSWSNSYSYGSGDWAKRQNAILTAYIARVLAENSNGENKSNENQIGTLGFALKRAVNFLRPQVEAYDEPYLIASYALIATHAKETNEANRAIARLEKLAKEEGTGSYWALEANTPFYGWGLAGRVETTAIVLQALSRNANNKTLINRGLLFLLKQKDRYGVWYSTQATINVLDALISLLQRYERDPRASMENKADVFVDGKFINSISLPNENELTDPLIVDLSNFINEGNNRIEVRREGNIAPASAQVVMNYYVAWEQFNAERVKQTNSSLLRLSVNYDKPNAEITETITCNVEAERIGYRGYGMLLAEIGLPPGADVDRQSLEDAMKESGWSFTRYDVLPDKVVAYLWPSAGGVKFNFKFKPRYGIKAKGSPSQLYDYYNPEARVVIAPIRFVVK
jgi:hypothetical protein